MLQSVRIKIIAGLFLCFFLGVIIRLFTWQVLSYDSLSAAADSQHFYRITVPAKRGEIQFSDSKPLVSNKNSFLLFANLTKVSSDKDTISEKLAEILAPQIPLISTVSAELTGEDKDKFLKNSKEDLKKKFADRLNSDFAIWVNLAHFVSRGDKKRIDSLKFSGINFSDEQVRDYPESSMAAHVAGFVGADRNGNPKGYFGLEGFYERELSGKPGETRVEKDAFGRPIAIGQEERREEENGHALITTIDRSVQSFVEQELQKGISDWKAKGGTAIVSDPFSGAIIAMASFPAYNPDTFSYYPTDQYKNPAITDLYEPGSIMKPLVMAAALNENKLTPDTRCDKCVGPRQIGGYFIHTFDNHYHPQETMTEVLINSDNTGMIFVGEKLGFKNLYGYFQKFGFNEKSGVDLEEDEGGNLRPISSYYPVDQATMSFGQGISVTSLQMVRAFNALANGGKLPNMHLVSQIDTGEKVISLSHPPGRQVISPDAAKTIAEMMVEVANKSPEHFPKDRIAELANFRIAAKSGTAQIALGGKYGDKGTNASVIGFFPAEKPRYVIMVKLNSPEVRPWGSDTAGPVFFSIVRDLINYYGITP